MKYLRFALLVLGLAGLASAQNPCGPSTVQGWWVCSADSTVLGGHYVKYNASGSVSIGATTDTHGALGAMAQGSASGQIQVVSRGPIVVVLDGATTANDYVQLSSTAYAAGSAINGDYHDAGSTRPAGPVEGKVLQTVSSTGTYAALYSYCASVYCALVDLFGPDAVGFADAPFNPLTFGATITWGIGNAAYAKGTVTLSGNAALNVTGLVSGGDYQLKITQDGTGSRTLTPGTGCTWLTPGGTGTGFFGLSTAASAKDLIVFTYDGTNCIFVIDKALAAP